jgi:hypothetical protein
MFRFFNKQKKNNKDFQTVAKRQLKANETVLKSLRDYDEGKKEISTANVRKHLQHIQASL